MMILETVLLAIVSSLLSGGAVGLVAKKWLDHSFNVRLGAIEAKYRMQAYEHQVRFTRYDEKVATAIEGAYSLVCDYCEAIHEVVKKAYDQGRNLPEGEFAIPDEVAIKFSQFMQSHSIYLPEDISKKLILVRCGLRDAFQEELIAMGEVMRAPDDQNISIALNGMYRKTSFRDTTDQLLAELQSLARSHLSKFALTS